MMEQYFLLQGGEDGLTISKYTKEKLETLFAEMIEDENGDIFLDDFPEDRWIKSRERIDRDNYLDEGEMILLKGIIVKPKVVEVVKRLEID